MDKVQKLILSFLFAILCVAPFAFCLYVNNVRHITGEDTIPRKDTVRYTLHDVEYIERPEYADTLTDYQIMIMAIASVESNYNEKAISKNGKYYGLFQMDAAYIKRANEIMKSDINKETILNFETALDVFLAMNDEYAPGNDVERSIRFHNRGAEYRNRIHAKMEQIRKYEQARRKLRDAYREYE